MTSSKFDKLNRLDLNLTIQTLLRWQWPQQSVPLFIDQTEIILHFEKLLIFSLSIAHQLLKQIIVGSRPIFSVVGSSLEKQLTSLVLLICGFIGFWVFGRIMVLAWWSLSGACFLEGELF